MNQYSWMLGPPNKDDTAKAIMVTISLLSFFYVLLSLYP